MNFFDHKNLGNHLLQLRPKVVKHPVYLLSIRSWNVTIFRVTDFYDQLRSHVPCGNPCKSHNPSLHLSYFMSTDVYVGEEEWRICHIKLQICCQQHSNWKQNNKFLTTINSSMLLIHFSMYPKQQFHSLPDDQDEWLLSPCDIRFRFF